MASDADPVARAEDTVLLEADEVTRAEDEWPVADHYLVEPNDAAGDTTVVVQRAETPPAMARRRLPPGLGTGLMLTIAGVAGAILLAILLLGLRESENTRGGTPAAVTSPRTSAGPAAADDGEIALRDVTGLALREARSLLKDDGLRVRSSRRESDRPRGEILSRNPAPRSETAMSLLASPPVGQPRSPRHRAWPCPRSSGSRLPTPSVRSARPVSSRGCGSSPRRGRPGPSSGSSTGPVDADVPEVTGMDQQSAMLELEKVGFEVRVIDEPTTYPAQDGLVIRQTPPGGSSTTEGAVVTLTVARLR